MDGLPMILPLVLEQHRGDQRVMPGRALGLRCPKEQGILIIRYTNISLALVTNVHVRSTSGDNATTETTEQKDIIRKWDSWVVTADLPEVA